MAVFAACVSLVLVLSGALSLRLFPGGPGPVLITVSAGIAAGIAAAAGAGIALSRRFARLESQRDAFYAELTRLSKVASLGEVSSGIAHDLNNPLAVMNEEAGWIADLLGAAEQDPAHAREEILNSLDQIQLQIRRSRDIVRRVLNWARDAGEEAGAVDLNDLLDKTLYLLESDLQTADVRVVRRLEADLPQVAAGAAELRQVLVNLMKNALDAMEGGGTLTLTTERTGEGSVRAAISDTGRGIPAEQVPRLFEPFFTTKPEGRGTGLGLSISSWIVRKLGGRIDVASTVGRGSTFTVTLPAAPASSARTEGGMP